MHDIICPHCSKAFKVDEAGYANILKQVRDRDFEQQLNNLRKTSLKLLSINPKLQINQSIEQTIEVTAYF